MGDKFAIPLGESVPIKIIFHFIFSGDTVHYTNVDYLKKKKLFNRFVSNDNTKNMLYQFQHQREIFNYV